MHTRFTIAAHALARVVTYPALVIGFVAVHLALVDRVPASSLPLLNLAMSVAAMAAVFVLERALPARRDWLASRGDFIADSIQSFVILPVVAAAAQMLDVALLPSPISLGARWPILAQVAVALVVAELFFYLVHRASHATPILWRLHRVHHGAPRVYWANSGRFHPLDLIVQFPIYFAPLVILGLSPQAFSLFLLVNAVTGLLEHANIDVRLGFLNFVMNGPELHRRHHALDARENYGKVLAIWDVVFRTHRMAAATERVTDDVVGADADVPVTLLGQLAHPFKAPSRALAKAGAVAAAAVAVTAVVVSGACATVPAAGFGQHANKGVEDDAAARDVVEVVDGSDIADAVDARVLRVSVDAHGRPRCLTLEKTEKARVDNVFLRWDDDDRYQRAIEAVRLPLSCSEWHDVVRDDGHGWRVLPKGAAAAWGAPMSPAVQERLAMIRRGADDVVADPTAVSIATQGTRVADASASVAVGNGDVGDVGDVGGVGGVGAGVGGGAGDDERAPFTLADNVALTKKYGHGIAGELYARDVLARPGNAEARAEILGTLDEQLREGEAAANEDTKARMKNTVVLVSMGFGWDNKITPDTVSYVKDFLLTVQELGVAVEVLDRDPFGGLASNAKMLQPQIEKHLAKGEDVVLVGLSKGTPEMLSAAADLVTLDDKRAQVTAAGRGRLAGVVNMSGMMDGLIFGDWATAHQPIPAVASSTLGMMPFWKDGYDIARYAWVLPRIDTPSIRAFNKTYVKRLPSDVTYLDVIGVVPDDAILKTDAGAMQPFIEMDRKDNIAGAANDGFVRYPGNETPRGVAPGRQYAVTVAGSHMLFDGSVAERSLQDAKVRRSLIRAAVLFVTETHGAPDAARVAANAE